MSWDNTPEWGHSNSFHPFQHHLLRRSVCCVQPHPVVRSASIFPACLFFFCSLFFSAISPEQSVFKLQKHQKNFGIVAHVLLWVANALVIEVQPFAILFSILLFFFLLLWCHFLSFLIFCSGISTFFFAIPYETFVPRSESSRLLWNLCCLSQYYVSFPEQERQLLSHSKVSVLQRYN